jgi:hypothetical protein
MLLCRIEFWRLRHEVLMAFCNGDFTMPSYARKFAISCQADESHLKNCTMSAALMPWGEHPNRDAGQWIIRLPKSKPTIKRNAVRA